MFCSIYLEVRCELCSLHSILTHFIVSGLHLCLRYSLIRLSRVMCAGLCEKKKGMFA